MHAIETEYAGYRFRSRLEARWAVFFDTAGIDFQYEPEGFEFGYRLEHGGGSWSVDGTWERPFRYLPDFWLPDHNAWVEVKGRWTPDDAWRFLNAAACLADNYTPRPEGVGVIIAGDIFRQPRYGITAPWLLTMHEGSMHGRAYDFGLTYADALDSAHMEVAADHNQCYVDPDQLLNGATVPADDTSIYKAAARAAQQARFEFGETPR